jgi:hypothetical protein
MATRLVCPECNASLKPARPVPDGVRVKCPKCSAPFTAPGLVDAMEEGIQQAPAVKAKAAPAKKEKAPPGATKKGEKKPSPAPAPAPAPSSKDDDDEGGTYALLDKPGDEAPKPEVSYAPDTSIKDLRGPAVAKIVPPSNHMIRFAAVGALVNLVIVLIQVWPFMFSDHLIDHRLFFEDWYKVPHPEYNIDRQKASQRLKAMPDDRKDLNDTEKEVIEDAEGFDRVLRIVLAIIYFFLMIYNGVIVVGATKMQNLESRTWGIVAAIMTLIIVSDGALLYFVWILGSLLISGLGFAGTELISYGNFLLLVQLLLAAAYPVVIGIWSLRVLFNPDVIAGFEYVPEDG